MTNETKAKGQLIELRGKGWSYEKISDHLGIDYKTLRRWGLIYKNCIDAEREINRSTLEEIQRLRAQTLDVEPVQQQESHFYNLRGESPPTSTTPKRGPLNRNRNPNLNRRRKPQSSIGNRKSKIVSGVRRLARSPLVRAAIRYAVLKH